MDYNSTIINLQDILMKNDIDNQVKKWNIEIRKIIKGNENYSIFKNGLIIKIFHWDFWNYILNREDLDINLDLIEDNKIVLDHFIYSLLLPKIIQKYNKDICFSLSGLYSDKNGKNFDDIFFFHYSKTQNKVYQITFLMNGTNNLLTNKSFPTFKKVMEEKKVELKEINNKFELFKNINNYSDYQDFFITGFPQIVQNWLLKYNYTGNSFNELMNISLTDKKIINKLSLEKLSQTIQSNKRIMVFWDYDSDGFNSMIILYKLFNFLWYKNYKFLFPTRSDKYIGLLDEKEHTNTFIGYGVKDEVINFVEKDDVLFAVDNGGFQLETLQKVKEKGVEILVIDHHNLNYDKKYENDKRFVSKKVNTRICGLKSNELETAFFIDSPFTYNHPLIESDFNLISASAITYMFVLEFFKGGYEKWIADISSEEKLNFLKNAIFHGAIWDITDVMSLLPISENMGRKVYEWMIEQLKSLLSIIYKNLWLSEKDIFAPYWLSSTQEQTRLKFINEKILTPYEKKGNRTIYSALNKEIFTMMLYKGITNLAPDDIGFMIWPIINLFGRLSSVEELFLLLASYTEKSANELKEILKEFKKITLINTIRNNTVAEWTSHALEYLKIFQNIAPNSAETYIPENLFQIVLLNTNRFYSFWNYVLNRRAKEKGMAISESDNNFFKKDIFSFIGSFNGLVSGKVSEKYVLSNFVLSCVTDSIKDNTLHFEGSGRGIGTINLNELLQFFIKDEVLLKEGIHIVGGGHNDAVGVHVTFTNFPKWNEKEVYRRIELIQKEYYRFLDLKLKQNPNFLKYFFSALTTKKTELLFNWNINDLDKMLNGIHNNIYNRFHYFGTDFVLPNINIEPAKLISLLLTLNANGKNAWKWNGYIIMLDTFMKKEIKELFVARKTDEISKLFNFLKLEPFDKWFIIRIK